MVTCGIGYGTVTKPKDEVKQAQKPAWKAMSLKSGPEGPVDFLYIIYDAVNTFWIDSADSGY